MTVNKVVNYTPDDPANCKPTSHMTCVYCRSARNCPNKMKYERYEKANSLEPESKLSSHNLF